MCMVAQLVECGSWVAVGWAGIRRGTSVHYTIGCPGLPVVDAELGYWRCLNIGGLVCLVAHMERGRVGVEINQIHEILRGGRNCGQGVGRSNYHCRKLL